MGGGAYMTAVSMMIKESKPKQENARR